MRRQAFDIARGFAIILVVLCHALGGVQTAMGETVAGRAFTVAVYSFHMSLFFLVSGAFAASALDEPLPKFANRLLWRFVWPYFLWSVIILFSHHTMSDYTNAKVPTVDLVSIIYAPPGVMWFLYCLFFTYIIARLLRPLPAAVRIAIALLALAGNYAFVDPMHIPPVAPRFVGLTLLAVEIGPKRMLTAAGNWIWIAMSGLTMLATCALAWQDAHAQIVGYPGAGLQYLPASFAGSLLVLSLSLAIEHLGSAKIMERAGKLFAFIGERTMPIFVSHVLVTAGTRIAMRLAGVTNGGLIILLATLFATFLPILAYEISVRLRLSRALGWR